MHKVRLIHNGVHVNNLHEGVYVLFGERCEHLVLLIFIEIWMSLRKFYQAHEILAHHRQIHVIIPGDESLMPDGAEQCAAIEEIPQIMKRAVAIEALQHEQQALLSFFQAKNPQQPSTLPSSKRAQTNLLAIHIKSSVTHDT